MTAMIIVLCLQKLLRWSLLPIYFILSLRPSKRLPAIKSPLLLMSVSRVAAMIRNGEVKSREVVDACIKRIGHVNPTLNAVVQCRFEQAQQEADLVDEYIAANKDNLEIIVKEQPLLGVPCTVKESCSLKGMSLSVGCLPLKSQIAEEDGAAVKELKKAGAIPLCVTNTPELCLCWVTTNLVTGTTSNPYNTNKNAGGSSGGEGALIGAGASLFGIGSDLAGSVRVPAMFNGIFGHKPTSGTVSVEGHYPMAAHPDFRKYLTVGALARHAEDLPLLMKILCAERGHLLNLDEKVDLTNLKVYFMEEATTAWYRVPVAQEIKDKMRDAVLYLKTAYGCHTEEGPFSELASSGSLAEALMLAVLEDEDVFGYTLDKSKTRTNVFVELIKSFFGLANNSFFGVIGGFLSEFKLFSKQQQNKFFDKNEQLKAKFKQVLGQDGVFLYPTFPSPAIHHSEMIALSSGARYSMVVNTLELPATHVPLGLDRNGLPIGVQVIAGPYQDRLCLAVAKALEERFGGWVPPS